MKRDGAKVRKRKEIREKERQKRKIRKERWEKRLEKKDGKMLVY